MKLATEVSQITEETWILTFYGLYVLSYSPGMHKRTGQRSCPSCLLEPATSRTAVSLRQKAVAGEHFWVSFPGIQLGGQGMSLDGSFEGEQHKEGENCRIEKVINGKHWEKVLMMLKKGQTDFAFKTKGLYVHHLSCQILAVFYELCMESEINLLYSFLLQINK